MPLEIDAPPLVELHSLLLQEVALQAFDRTRFGARAHTTLGVHHAVPGEIRFAGQTVERVADEPRVSG
jgi:hypothetical protein